MRPPTIHPTAFIASTAAVMGDVTLGEEASVWYCAVLRGDMAPIVVGAQSNIQDGTVVHVDEGLSGGPKGWCRPSGRSPRLHRGG